ncbi:MAG: hypothetical protein AB1513_00400 [Pseudomonadota bacterium]
MANIVNALKSPFARLAALWPRRRTPATEGVEAVEAEEPDQAEPPEGASPLVAESTQPEPGEDDEAVEGEARAGWRDKLRGLFSFHKRSVAAGEAGDEVADDEGTRGDGVDAPGVDDAEDLPPARPGWKMRLVGLLKRMSLRKRATVEEGGESNVDENVASFGAKRRRTADAEDEEGADEEASPSLAARAKAVLIGTPAKLAYVAVLVVGAVMATQYGIWQIVARQNEALDAMHSKNVELRKEKRNLEKREQKLMQQVAKAEARASGSAASGAAGSAGGTNTDLDDCAVTNAKDAANNLKRCIGQYNAMTRR